MKTHPIYESLQKSDNEKRNGIHSNSCVCCSKIIKNIKHGIHTTTDWVAVDEQDEAKVPNSQGWFPVGSECAKHFPKEFLFSLNITV
jgi:hypothetical protein